MQKILRKSRIPAEIVRPDIRITDGNCAYAVLISEFYLPEAIEILRRGNLTPGKVILEEKYGEYREISV